MFTYAAELVYSLFSFIFVSSRVHAALVEHGVICERVNILCTYSNLKTTQQTIKRKYTHRDTVQNQKKIISFGK